MMQGNERSFILSVVVVTLAIVIVMVVGCMLYGLFEVKVDNEDIFSMLGPAFQTIVGCFVGLLGGLVMGGKAPAGTAPPDAAPPNTTKP